MVLTTAAIPSAGATRAVGQLMVLAPHSPSLPKLLLKPGRWTVGSAATCSYQIAAEGVRPRHALLLCGGQANVLKAWDANTWHNGQPVRGEVRLQPGDHITVGSVDFDVEPSGASDLVAQLPDVPHELPVPKPEADGWDLERLREQIQELRDELSQRVIRRTTATTASQQNEHVNKLSARVTELEQAATEARQLNEHLQREREESHAEQQRREAELLESLNTLRSVLEDAQQNTQNLRNERDQLLADAVQREQAWESHSAEWAADRDRWQAEFATLANAQQQLTADAEQRQDDRQAEAARWQFECEQLRAEWQQQQTAWTTEHARLLEESLRHEEAVQQAQQAAAQREQERAEQARQILAERQQVEADRQQLETDRQQFQAECQEREQTGADICAERELVQQQAAEIAARLEEVSRRMTEFEQQQAEFVRQQQVLEHSWNWLQSDRRKLVEEKTQWQQQRAEWQVEQERWADEREQLQRERDELDQTRRLIGEQGDAASVIAAEREQLQAAQAAWVQQQAQTETEWRDNIEQLEAARAELSSQQQALRDERHELQTLRTELESRVTDLEREHAEFQTAALPDSWSIGVDLTAPREPVADHDWETSASSVSTFEAADADAPPPLPTQTAAESTWTTRSFDRPLAEISSLAQFCVNDPASPAIIWEASLHGRCLADFVNSTTDDSRRPEAAWETSLEHGPITTTNPSNNPIDSDAAALRAHLAEMFHLPGLRDATSSPANSVAAPTSTADADCITPPGTEGEVESVSNVESTALPSETTDNWPQATSATEPTPETATTSPTDGPVGSILETLAFAEDENVDDSVSRYMQHLLARSQQPGGFAQPDRYISVQSVKASNANPTSADVPFGEVVIPDAPIAVAAEPTPIANVEQVPPALENPPLDTMPVTPRESAARKLDRDAIRTATEQMRQVANQQTLKNVQASNWNRLKLSIKTKSSLAAFSFVLSGGLLILGYYYKPAFWTLGICASGLGVMTWVDLFIAIREARSRTKQLAGRKKKPGPAKP